MARQQEPSAADTSRIAADGNTPAPESLPLPPETVAFARRIRSVLADQGRISAGALYLINLDKVRQVFEAQGRWKRLADRVHETCRRIIEQHLDAADLFHSLPGPIFMIVFAHLRPDVARAKCAMIAEEIGRHLTGSDPEFKDVTVGATVVVLKKDDVALDLIDLKAEAERLMGSGNAVTVLAKAESPNRPVTGEANPIALDNPWLPDVESDASQSLTDHEWYYEPKRECPPDLSFAYLPLWHVRHRAIGTFLCLPSLPIIQSQRLVGDAIFAETPPALACELDLGVLKKVMGDLESLLAGGKRALLSLSVHFETLAHSSSRRRYLSLCAELSEAARQHLTIELVDLPEGAPAGRISELLSYLRPFARILSVRTHLSQTQFEVFSAAKVTAVGVALGRETLPEAELFPRINGFAQAANAAGLRTYAVDLRTRSITTAALGAGFDYISGQMIGSITDAPDAAYRFEFADLYAGLLGERETLKP